jgi:hypothetical protein
MKKPPVLIILLIIIAGVLGYLGIATYFGTQWKTSLELKNGMVLTPYVMDSPFELGTGLTKKGHIEDSSGALFIFDHEGYYKFWTKDMKFPVDIVWINEGWQVVDITKDARPCSGGDCPTYMPKKPARYILEINGGLADRYNITEGDFIKVVG